MSYRPCRAVLERSGARGNARLVLAAIAWEADGTGTWSPNVARIADLAGLSPRTVRRHIASLLDAGELIERGAAYQVSVCQRAPS